jgi:hypothetical protein
VITCNERTARWAAEPIDLGRGQMVLRPLVIGPRQIPHMLELADARRYPELAALAVVVHGRRGGSKRLGRNAIKAVMERVRKGRGRDTLLLDLIMAFLSKAALHELEDEMELQLPPRFSKFAKQHFAEGLQEGRQEGRQQALSLVLGSRGLTLTPAQRRRVALCKDPEQLDGWLQRAGTIKRIEELFDAKQPARARRRVAAR